jgi:hypothetical protein
LSHLRFEGRELGLDVREIQGGASSLNSHHPGG